MPTDQTGFYIDLQVTPVEGGGVYVRSDQVPGLHLHGRYLNNMRSLVEATVKRLFRDNRGVSVNVIWLFDAATFPQTVEDVPARLAIYPNAA